MQSRKQLDNLIPGAHKLTAEELKRGGERSVEVKRKKRSLREAADLFNSMKPNKKDYETVMSELDDFDPNDVDRQMAIVVKLYKLAMAGNVKAMKLYLEISDDDNGEKKRLEIEKLKAEIESMKNGSTQDGGLPTFVFEFKDFSMENKGGQ